MINDAHDHRNGTLGSHAVACVAAGLCALPAVRRGDEKRVALRSWKPFQSRLPSSDELGEWFASDAAAMCLVCGTVSGNLEMIDFDLGGAAFDAWRHAVETASPGLVERLVIESTPSGGKHAVYRCDAPVSGNTKLAQRAIDAAGPEALVVGSKTHMPRRDASGNWSVVVTMIETRGEGGLFLCAPSDGYEILQGDLCEPPLITADERDLLLGCAWTLDELPAHVVDGGDRSGSQAEAKVQRTGNQPANSGQPIGSPSPAAVRPGDDFNERGNPRDVLLRHGWTLARAGDSGVNEHWRRPGKDAGTSATLKDRVFYVFSTNAQPFEAHVGYSPFAVYALLEHHGDFTAAASALAAEGYGESDRTHGVDLSAFTAQAPAATASLRPAPLLVGELVDAHPQLRPPVIHGLLREGETMNIIASPKTGKSWLTLDLAIAIATGRAWLGRYETEPGEVLIIDNELHRETSAHRIPQVARARGVAIREIRERIAVDNLRGRLEDIFTLAPYFEAIDPGRYKVIVLDAFYRFMPAGGDENDNGTMANIYNRLDAFADRLRCCFVLIHHSTKGSQSGKSVTDVGAGAGAQSRATDTHLVLRPHEENGVVVLDAAVRSWAPVEPTCLRWTFPTWSVDDGLDPAALKPERPQKRREPAQAAEPKEPDWTADRFAATFINVPRTREEVVSAARECGLSDRAARRLTALAVTEQLVTQEPFNGRSAPRLIPANAQDGAGGDL